MRRNSNIFQVIFLLSTCSIVFSQTAANKFISTIPEKDTFNVSNPINQELLDYFSDPNNYQKGMYFYSTKGLNNCAKAIPKKEYWHSDKEHLYSL